MSKLRAAVESSVIFMKQLLVPIALVRHKAGLIVKTYLHDSALYCLETLRSSDYMGLMDMYRCRIVLWDAFGDDDLYYK